MDDNAIEFVLNARIMSGVADGKFNPQGELTIEQFATVLVNAKIVKKVDSQKIEQLTSGLKISTWAKSYVAALIESGAIKKEDLQNTNTAITREQAASMLDKLIINNN